LQECCCYVAMVTVCVACAGELVALLDDEGEDEVKYERLLVNTAPLVLCIKH